MDLKSFSKYTRPDREKRALIDSALPKAELKMYMMKVQAQALIEEHRGYII